MPAEKLLFSFSSAEAVFFHLLPAVLLPAPMHGLLSLLCCILSFSIAIVLSALHHDLPSLVSLSSLQGGCFVRWAPLPSLSLCVMSSSCAIASLLRRLSPPGGMPFLCSSQDPAGDFLNSYESQNCFCLNLQLPLSCALRLPLQHLPPRAIFTLVRHHAPSSPCPFPLPPASCPSPRLSLRSLCLFSLPVSCCFSPYVLHCALRTTAVIRAQM